MESNEAVSSADMAELAKMRSASYAFLSHVYSYIPDQSFVTGLTNGTMVTVLDQALTAEDAHPDIQTGLSLIKSYVDGCRTLSPEQILTDLQVEWTRLMRGIQPYYSPPPPYEYVYTGGDERAVQRSHFSVLEAYRSAGVDVPDPLQGQPDFIGYELDFMRHLTAKEGEAWEAGNQVEASRLLEKENAFLDQHIVRWIPQFCDEMIKLGRMDFYRGIGHLTKGFLLDDVHRAVELWQWARTADVH